MRDVMFVIIDVQHENVAYLSIQLLLVVLPAMMSAGGDYYSVTTCQAAHKDPTPGARDSQQLKRPRQFIKHLVGGGSNGKNRTRASCNLKIDIIKSREPNSMADDRITA
jgi:hypothetical protein